MSDWKKIQLVALHTDQGMGNLVKIYTEVMGSVVLTNLVIADLGSESRRKRYAGDAVDDIMAALKEMEDDYGHVGIDMICISHQDYDHWSLFTDLREKIGVKYPSLTVNKLITGGQRWKSDALAEIKALEKAFKVGCEVFSRACSDYDSPLVGAREFYAIAGVKFRVLAANSPTTRGSEDLVRNGTSAVVVVEAGTNKFILPGDATADTVAFINNILQGWLDNGKPNPILPCYVLSAPHHGALRTLADNFTTSNPQLSLATKFADLTRPECIAASAGWLSSFHHPFKRVLNLLGAHAVIGETEHDYVQYDDEVWPKAWECVPKSKKKIYTTILSLTDPPQRTSWTFSLQSSGINAANMQGYPAAVVPAPGRLIALPAKLLNSSLPQTNARGQ
ncbi:MAG: hypothetical protein WC378_02090 [Opitutaceae bacterium]|jgi:beta-lactamase superfamily II metal-dependent hydrolase